MTRLPLVTNAMLERICCVSCCTIQCSLHHQSHYRYRQRKERFTQYVNQNLTFWKGRESL